MKVIFLDRDGVINEYPGDFEYVKSWGEFKFLPRVKEALKELDRKGYKLFVISNQAGVGKGTYSQDALDLITKNMLSELKKEGVELSGVYYCTHRKEENCSCRKPKTGLVDAVYKRLGDEGIRVDLQQSYFIGDTIRDVHTGRDSGLKTILVFSGKEKPQNKTSWEVAPDFLAEDLFEAATKVVR